MANILRFPGPSFSKPPGTKSTGQGASTGNEKSEVRVHGGDLDVARQIWPSAPEPWIDLSTGINPHSYPLPEIPAESWQRLPLQSELDELCAAAADRYGVLDPGMVVAAHGSQTLIQLVPRLFEPKTVAVVGPTYSEHAARWRAAGHDVSIVSDLEAAAQADVVVVVNPNNPTGLVIPGDILNVLASALAARGGLLIVDEAFVDFANDHIGVSHLTGEGMLVMRSFGKAYGLAGVRLGFGIARAPLSEKLREALGPWPVGSAALQIGTHALRDGSWAKDMKRRLEREVARLWSLLEGSGFVIHGASPLFLLARHRNASQQQDLLGRAGINVRVFDDAPDWIRFGVPGSEEAWSRLESVLLSD